MIIRIRSIGSPGLWAAGTPHRWNSGRCFSLVSWPSPTPSFSTSRSMCRVARDAVFWSSQGAGHQDRCVPRSCRRIWVPLICCMYPHRRDCRTSHRSSDQDQQVSAPRRSSSHTTDAAAVWVAGSSCREPVDPLDCAESAATRCGHIIGCCNRRSERRPRCRWAKRLAGCPLTPRCARQKQRHQKARGRHRFVSVASDARMLRAASSPKRR